MQRSKKVTSLIFLACGFLAWLLFREVFATLWVIAHLPSPEGWVIAPQEILSIVVGVVTFVLLIKSEKVVNFTEGTLSELSKVAWPNRKETALSTVVVAILVAICAVILFGFDMVWGAVVRIFYQ